MAEGCRQALRRAVARKVEDRWPSVGEFCRALQEGFAVGAPAVTPTVARPEISAAEARNDSAVEKALERAGNWRKRSEIYEQLPERIGDAERCLGLIDRLRRGRRDGNDLCFLDRAARAVAERWPEAAEAAGQLRGRLYDHLPPPGDPRPLFRWQRPDGEEQDLWCPVPVWAVSPPTGWGSTTCTATPGSGPPARGIPSVTLRAPERSLTRSIRPPRRRILPPTPASGA